MSPTAPGLRRRLRGRVWFTALGILLGLADVRAQEAVPKKEDPGPVMTATFGWGGVVPVERWAPITVYVGAGDRALSGTITVEFPQDSTQSARITVPFAATPNRTTPVPVVATLPQMCDRMTITMADERGSVVSRLRFAHGQSDLTIPMPAFLDVTQGLFVCVGRCSLPDSIRAWTSVIDPLAADRARQTGRRAALASPDLQPGWMRASSAWARVEDMPVSAAAYDGVTALVVNPASVGPEGRTADPRAIEAVQAWVRSGGRLVVLADAAGDLWRNWVPPEARGFLAVEPAAAGPLPETVAQSIRRGAQLAAQRARAAAEVPGAEAGTEPPWPEPAETVARRVIHLTDAARASGGWRVRWAVDTEGPQDRWPGLLAEGPVGYGYVTVLGMDPAKAPAAGSSRAASPVWQSALETTAGDWLQSAAGFGQAYGSWWASGSARAVSAAVERLGDVPAIGDSIFLVIAGAALVLVLLVGPVDYLVLKRLQAGQRSWLTALAWIVLASVAAYGAPRLIRTAPSQLNRVSVVDRMLHPPGEFEGAVAPALTYRVGMTAVYAGESGAKRFADPDPASWWRGVAVSYGEEEFSGVAVVPTVQAAAGGESGSARGNPLTEFPMALWTFRAFADHGVPRPGDPLAGVAGRVYRTSESGGGWHVTVGGLPEGVVVNEAVLRVGEKWYGLTERPMPPEPARAVTPWVPDMERKPPVVPPIVPVGMAEPGSWSGVFRDEFGGGVAGKAWSNPPPDQNNFGWGAMGMEADLRPGPLLDLPGPDRRGLAVSRYVEAGTHACICLNITSCPTEVRLERRGGGGGVKDSHTAVLRLLVPLEGGDGKGEGGT